MTATVLVVEDNPITRKMLCFALESEGYGALEAGDGATALKLAARGLPDLVLLDNVLPDMEGLRVLEGLRRLPGAASLPVVMLTGMVSRLEELRARSGGSVTILPKPIEPSRLMDVVRAHLARGTAAVGRGRRVLVVDDEPLNLKLATLRLRDAGFSVETASGGAEALAKVRVSPPDALLSDILMPGIDGFLLCRAVREDPSSAKIPVVLVSASYVEERDRRLARDMGASRLVLRTPDLKEAIEALAEVLGDESPPEAATRGQEVDALHKERVQIQLEKQVSRNEALMRQAAIQAAALSVVRGLGEALARTQELPAILGDVLVHCLDAAGLSTGLLYFLAPDGSFQVKALAGVPTVARGGAADAFGHPELLHAAFDAVEPIALTLGSPTADAPGARELLLRLGTASALIIPFVVLDRPYGALLLASDAQDLSESGWSGFGRALAAQFGQTIALGQALARLARSEQRLRCLAEGDIIGVSVADVDGKVLEANDHYLRMIGYDRNDVEAGRIRWDSMTPPEYRPLDEKAVRSLIESGRADPWEKEMIRKDGSRVPVQLGVAMLEGRECIAYVQDISERKRAQDALRAAQERIEHVVFSNPAVLYSLKVLGEPAADAAGREGAVAQSLLLTWISSNVERLFGYTVTESLEKDWWFPRVHPDDRESVAASFMDVFADRERPFECRFRFKDGTYRWLRCENHLLRDAGGKPVEIIGSLSDVTGRKDAELNLQESEEQYRLLFDSNPQPMWVFDEETLRFLAVNDAAVRHYGYSREEFLGMTVLQIRPPEEIERFESEHRSRVHARAPGSAPGAWKHLRKDGTAIEVEGAASPILFHGRRAWLTLVSDVTSRKSLEAQLAQAQKMETVGRLAGGIAHDFNNLLGVMTGYGELLRRRLAGDERLRKYAEDIIKAAERAAGLTRQLLAFSRKQILQPRIIDLNDAVGDMEKMLRRLIGEDIHLITVFDDKLGSVRADPGQIEQVLMNLAINARDAMPRGGRLTIETGNVDLDSSYSQLHPDVEPGRYAMMAVSDTGHGMDAEILSHIFEPFFTTKEAGKGTGLGLATAHGIVKQSDGQIFVYSEPGRGTTFKIYLPRVDEAAAAPLAPAVEAELPGGSETVLLAEDEAALRELVAESLRSMGYLVLEARHAGEALAIGEQHPIDLLITDVVMPAMSGRELGERLAVLQPALKVLYMSGYTDDAVVLHGVLSEGVPFLQKPFTAEALARKLREVLDAKA